MCLTTSLQRFRSNVWMSHTCALQHACGNARCLFACSLCCNQQCDAAKFVAAFLVQALLCPARCDCKQSSASLMTHEWHSYAQAQRQNDSAHMAALMAVLRQTGHCTAWHSQTAQNIVGIAVAKVCHVMVSALVDGQMAVHCTMKEVLAVIPLHRCKASE